MSDTGRVFPRTLSFGGKLAVVVGGASGIGAATAHRLAGCGAHVVIADRQVAAANAIASAVGGYTVEIDVSDADSVSAAATAIEASYGPVAILVNSAGVLQRTLPPGELSVREWDLVSTVDLRGTYLCSTAFGTRMAARGAGAIVNVASVAGMRSGPLHSYGPAKAGVIHLTACLAAEWGPCGVRVNAVSPGFTETPALRRGIENHTLNEAAMSSSSALGRLVKADEIADAIAFLASDLASAITGINLPVDAGYLVATPWLAYGGLRGEGAVAARE